MTPYLNLKKTKILSTEKINVFRFEDDHVEGFIFLGSKIEVTGACGGEMENSNVRIDKDLER